MFDNFFFPQIFKYFGKQQFDETCFRVIFNTLFGLSVNFWMAVCTRFLLGSLNGLLGPIKAYAVEIFTDEYQALGLSTVSTAWGIGLIIGPALGGFLAQVLLVTYA